jgi:hypothetical protein
VEGGATFVAETRCAVNDPHTDERPVKPEDPVLTRDGREALEPGSTGPNLVLVERASEPHATPEGESAEAEEGHRAQKVAEARIKILNGYYARSDVQRELAERLIFELGA